MKNDDARAPCDPDDSQLAKLKVDIEEAMRDQNWERVRDIATSLLMQKTSSFTYRQDSGLRHDRLTVFQAEPLVYMDKFGVPNPMEPLNFAWEKEALLGALADARADGSQIDLEFDIATFDRLNAFLSSSQCSPILHISCHGVKEAGLAIEDNAGATHFVGRELLENYCISRKDEAPALKVVFVSACHSRSTGEAFIDAGIPHVICCRAQEARIRDSAAIEFTKSFYRALASGSTLLYAFELAKKQVKLSSEVKDSLVEMEKFVLLPEGNDEYHNIPVFFTRPFVRRPPSMGISPMDDSSLPSPPVPLVGRETDVYNIIVSLRHRGIVYLVGPEGVGKGCVASAVAKYVNDRRKLLYLDKVVWCSPLDRNSNDPLHQAIHDLFHLIATSPAILEASDYRECRGRIVHYLNSHRTLLVIDAREIASTEIPMLSSALQDILNWLTLSVKMLIICRDGESINLSGRFSPKKISLKPLTFESSAKLFATKCEFVSQQSEYRDPLVNSVNDFVNLIFSRDDFREHRMVDDSMSQRSAELFAMLGAGSPQKINELAIKPEHYKSIIKTARKQEMVFKINTRHKLVKTILQAKIAYRVALNEGRYQNAQQQWEKAEALEFLKRKMPSKLILTKQIEQLTEQYQKAVTTGKSRQEIIDLRQQRRPLEFQLEEEIRESEENPMEEDEQIVDDEISSETSHPDPELVGEEALVAMIHIIEGDAPAENPPAIEPCHPMIKYRISGKQGNSFLLQINRGPVQSFSYSPSEQCAIVVASNEACTGGVGVLRAVTDLGGPSLLKDVESLATVLDTKYGTVRCLASEARLVGPGQYNRLPVPYVIFAVGPWFTAENEDHSFVYLTGAYRAALEQAREAKLEALGFSLIGASCRAGMGWIETVRIGFDAIAGFDGYPELKEIHVFGYEQEQADELVARSKRYDLEVVEL